MGDSPKNQIDPERERLGRMIHADSVKSRASGERERLGRMSLKRTPQKSSKNVFLWIVVIICALILIGVAVSIYRQPKEDPEENSIITKTVTTSVPTKELELPLNVKNLTLKEVDYYFKLADEGDRVAQYIIGLIYTYDTVYSTVNMEKAYEYFSLSAKQGYPSAFVDLGMMYYNGQYVEKNEVIAVEWLQKAADAGEPAGLYLIGLEYYLGEVYNQDLEKAFSYFSKAADGGNHVAHLYLGYCYWNGEGVEKDEEKALRELRTAARSGIERAFSALAKCYWKKGNYDQAYTWARQAAEAESEYVRGDGKYCMARFYESGITVERDLEKAKALYLEAQELSGSDYSEEIARVEKKMEE